MVRSDGGCAKQRIDGRPVHIFARLATEAHSIVEKQQIDTATNTVIGSPIAVGFFPFGVAVTPDGSRVHVTNQASNTVSVIPKPDGLPGVQPRKAPLLARCTAPRD